MTFPTYQMVTLRRGIYYMNYTGDFIEGTCAPCPTIKGMARERCGTS